MPSRLIVSLLPVLLTTVAAAQAPQQARPGATTHLFATTGSLTPFELFANRAFGGFAQVASQQGADNRAEAFTFIALSGLGQTVSSFGSLEAEFDVDGLQGTVLDAIVTMDAQWNGLLFGVGLGKTTATVKIVADLIDDGSGQIVGSATLLDQKLDSTALKGLAVGGNRVSGTGSVAFPTKVTRGRSYRARLRVECSSVSGLVGGDLGCHFGTALLAQQGDIILGTDFSSVPGDFFAKWTSLQITIEPDLAEKLDLILENQQMLMEQNDEMLEKNEQQLQGQQEIIDLLRSPPGQRNLITPGKGR